MGYKKTTFFVGILLFLIIGITLTVSAEPEVWVNSSFSPANETHFPNITSAIEAVSENGIVNVLSGIYIEQLDINKSISLIGEDKETTIIDGNETENINVIYLNKSNISITRFTIKNGAYELNNILIKIGRNSSYNNISNNNLIASRYGIEINDQGNNNSIINNYFSDMREECGVIAYGGSNNIIKNNIMNFSGQDVGAWTGIAIFSGGLETPNNNRIINNTITGPNTGLFFARSHANFIVNNTVGDAGFGIFLGRSVGNTIANNNFLNIGKGDGYGWWQGNEGINLFHSSNNTVINNNISMRGIKYGHGIIMTSSSYNLVQGNIIESAARGIGIFNLAKDNEIKYNNILSSKEYGMILYNSEDNMIYNNNFLDNNRQAYDHAGTDNWNSSEGGNYWSDFPQSGNYSIYPHGTDYNVSSEQIEISHPEIPVHKFIETLKTKNENFFINDTQTWENQKKNISYLLIENEGDLTIRNTTLIFDTFASGIEVNPGASLYIYNSNITCIGYGCGFDFMIFENSVFEMKNSTLRGSGIRPEGGEWGGLDIRTKNATVINNTLLDCGGIGLYGSEFESISLNETSVYIINNTIMNCYDSLHLAGALFDENHVADNIFINTIDRFLLTEWNSNLSISAITSNSVTIEWKTFLISNSIVEYGQTNVYGQIESEPDLTNDHSVTLSGLSPETTYHFKIKSTDEVGYTLFSSDYTFTTLAEEDENGDTNGNGGNGGGGGGGGGGATPPIETNETEDEEEYELVEWGQNYSHNSEEFSEIEFINEKIGEKERVIILIDGNEHHVGVVEVGKNDALIEVASTPFRFKLSVNESEKVDVTRDDYYDLEVILNAIEDNKVDLTINSIREAVPIVETTAPDVDEKSEERSRSLLWLWIVIGVIIFGIIVFILYNKKKK